MARSLLFSGLLGIPVIGALYILGLGLFAFYHAPENTGLLKSLNDLIQSTEDPNMILPHFVRNVLPSGLAGLVFAALFAATMSVFSSGLNSLSTATCMDFLQRRSNSKELTLLNARLVTLVWGLLVTFAAIGVYFARIGSLVEAGAGIVGFFSGPLLGMFLLGIFTMRANSVAVIVGAILGFAIALMLRNHISFIWYPVAGCVPTLLLGYALSYFTARPRHAKVYPMTIWGRHLTGSSSPPKPVVHVEEIP
jgi:sodium-coupled monocarboxylate transporter 8/12